MFCEESHSPALCVFVDAHWLAITNRGDENKSGNVEETVLKCERCILSLLHALLKKKKKPTIFWLPASWFWSGCIVAFCRQHNFVVSFCCLKTEKKTKEKKDKENQQAFTQIELWDLLQQGVSAGICSGEYRSSAACSSSPPHLADLFSKRPGNGKWISGTKWSHFNALLAVWIAACTARVLWIWELPAVD